MIDDNSKLSSKDMSINDSFSNHNTPKLIISQDHQKKLASKTPVFDETVMVDTLLTNNEPTMIEQESNASSPTLTKVTMGEITSFLVKSGQHQVHKLDKNIPK